RNRTFFMARTLALVGRELSKRFDVLLRAENERHALVQGRWCDVEDVLLAVDRRTASLFEDERHRVGLVQQAQLALRVLLVGRVREDASLQERALGVRDER